MDEHDDATDGSKRTGGCPFHDSTASEGGDSTTDKPGFLERAVDRRSFVRTALAIGGASAFAAVSGGVSGRQRGSGSPELGVPQGPTAPDAFPERQHAWNADIKRDPFGNVVLPTHQLILFLNYDGDGRPTGRER